jgi:hypothetical protein
MSSAIKILSGGTVRSLMIDIGPLFERARGTGVDPLTRLPCLARESTSPDRGKG